MTTPNEVALAVNHWLVWTLAWHAGHEEVLVLEDDADVGPDFWEEFEKSYDALPPDWEIAYAGYLLLPQAKYEQINDRITKVKYPWATHAMLLKRDVLPKLRLANEAMVDPIDVSIIRTTLDDVNHYCFQPQLVYQKTFEGEWDSLLGPNKEQWGTGE